jgi:hypothetical protein
MVKKTYFLSSHDLVCVSGNGIVQANYGIPLCTAVLYDFDW